MQVYKKLLLIISFGFLAAIIWSANPIQMLSIIQHGSIEYIALAFLVATISLGIRVLKWNVLVPSIRYRDLAPIQILGTTISNFTPGKFGEPAKALFLKAKTGYPISSALPSIIWERINDIVVLLLLSTLTFSILTEKLAVLGMIGLGVFVVILIVLLAMLYHQTLGKKIFHRLRGFPVVKNISSSFIDSFYTAKISTQGIGLSFVLSLLTWILDGFVFYLALRAVGIHAPPLLIVGMFALAVIIGVASTLPGGIGSIEFALGILYGLIGIPHEFAITAIILGRFVTIWYLSILGGISFLHMSKTVSLEKIVNQ